MFPIQRAIGVFSADLRSKNGVSLTRDYNTTAYKKLRQAANAP
jgi:hypothetical protein